MSIVAIIRKDAAKTLDRMGLTLPSMLEAGVLESAQKTTGIIRMVIYDTFQGRTGSLARSYSETFLGWSGAVVSAASQSDHVAARIQDVGGTIRPKTRKFLAVPVGAGKLLPVGKWPRDFAPGQLRFIKSFIRGRPSILAKVSKTKVEPMFVLVRSVTIPGKHYLDEASKIAAPVVAGILGEKAQLTVDHAIDRGGRAA